MTNKADFVQETTITLGVGSYNLNGATVGHRSLVAGNGSGVGKLSDCEGYN